MKNNYIKYNFIDNKKRPLMLIFPGGGYEYTSPREADPVAEFFNQNGYHTGIVYYKEVELKHPFLIENIIEIIRDGSKNKLISDLLVIGFSAGGHLAMHVMTRIPKKIKAGILAYSVITPDPKYYHRNSFVRLLIDPTDKKALREVSMEKQVKNNMPPIFIWHTVTDAVVPVENSILLFNALKKKGNSVELHLFESGRHALGLANRYTPFPDMDPVQFEEDNKRVAIWTILAINWLDVVLKK